MRTLERLFTNNRNWAADILKADPAFFGKLTHQQTPEFLWIGCSDSRVPANEIVGLLPGDLFVHRNVANLVVHSDMNCLSVIQYAVDILKVKHIIVCGHYGCGGIRAAFEKRPHGLIDNWLGHVRDLSQRRQGELSQLGDNQQRLDRLCELNIIEQVRNVGNTTFVQSAWDRAEPVAIHGWIYSISNGLLKDLGYSVANNQELAEMGY